METWLSYSLQDLVLFSTEAFFRLFELNNNALWPLQIFMLVVAVMLFILAQRTDRKSANSLAIILALLWCLVGWQFFHKLYAQINLAAIWFALLFSLEALLLLILGLRLSRRKLFYNRMPHSTYPGAMLLFYAAAIHPLAGLMFDRNWQGLEIFGIAPDPTALGTLGILLMMPGVKPRILAVIPFTWCLISGLTYLAMDMPLGLITPAIALLASIASIKKHSSTNLS